MARTRRRAGDADILREARARFERCVTWETTARAHAQEDAKFNAGDAYNNYQWDSSVRLARGDRPMLTLNKCRQHVLQIVNDARQAKAAIKVTPTGGRATYDAAQVFSGIIRRIEYQSKAVDAYSTATFHQIESGIGYVRITTDYADEDSFDQDIYIRRVPDPRMIYLDPDAQDWDKADMRFAFLFVDIPRDEWEADHGKDDSPARETLGSSDGWNDDDHVRVAEYWRRLDDNDTLYLLTDGTTVRDSELADGELEGLQEFIVNQRDITEPEIEWFRLVGDRVDERKTWPGKYIPIVPFIGEETIIEKTLDRKGHVRALLDAQRMYNYWNSAACEQVALQGKSPYIADIRALEGHQKIWDSANQVNWPYLPYNGVDQDSAVPVQPPQRAQPPVMAQAYLEGMEIARNDMMLVSGQYQAEMGAPGNEKSGKAIDARQRQSDNATAHYTDNQAKAIRQVGRICLDLIPKIYDVARVTMIMAEDGSDSTVSVQPNAPDAHQHVLQGPDGTPQPLSPEQAKAAQEDPNSPDPTVIFNPQVGRYDVEADVGPSYGTKREEAFNAFSQIMAQNSNAFAVVGDFWAENADFPGAQELADRLRKGLPPQYKGVDPMLEQTQQQAKQLLGQADQEIAQLKGQVAQLTAQLTDKAAETKVKDYDAETKRLAAIGSVDPALVQMIARQLWEDMRQTDLMPHMQRHAEFEQSIAPPPEAAAGAQASATQ